jgi:hypothetical protein
MLEEQELGRRETHQPNVVSAVVGDRPRGTRRGKGCDYEAENCMIAKRRTCSVVRGDFFARSHGDWQEPGLAVIAAGEVFTATISHEMDACE